MSKEQLLEGVALAENVEARIREAYGAVVAYPPAKDYDAGRALINKDLSRDLDRAERLVGDNQAALAYLSFLRGRLQALGQAIASNRGMLKCKEHYGLAIELGYDSALTRYHWALHNMAWEDYKDAATQLEQALVATSDPGMKEDIQTALNEARVKAAKGRSGCLGILLIVVGAGGAGGLLLKLVHWL